MSDDGLTSSITDFLEPSLNKGNEEKNWVVFKKLCHFLKLLKTGMMHYGNYI